MPELTKEQIIDIIKNDPEQRYFGEPELRTIVNGNNTIDKYFVECSCHKERVPFFNLCPDCDTPLYHSKTTENTETRNLHFIYECKGCPPGRQKTQYICNADGNNGTKEKSDLAKGFF